MIPHRGTSVISLGAMDTAIESLGTSNPMNSAGPGRQNGEGSRLAAASGGHGAFCDSTALGVTE